MKIDDVQYNIDSTIIRLHIIYLMSQRIQEGEIPVKGIIYDEMAVKYEGGQNILKNQEPKLGQSDEQDNISCKSLMDLNEKGLDPTKEKLVMEYVPEPSESILDELDNEDEPKICFDYNIDSQGVYGSGYKDDKIPQANEKHQEHPYNNMLIGTDLIFRQIDPSTQQIKNTNFAKFIIKHYYKEYVKPRRYSISDQSNIQLTQYNDQVFQQINHNGINKVTLQHLARVFGSKGNQQQKQIKKINRKLVRQMLRDQQFRHRQIYFSGYLKKRKNKKQYLLASKTYSLRCLCPIIAERLQTK